MYPQFTHCHSQELKLHFSVLSGSMQISSVSKTAPHKILLQLQRSKQEFAVMSEEELLAQEHPGHKSQLYQQLPLSPLLDRLFTSTWFFNEKTDLFHFASGLFFLDYLRPGEQPGPSHPGPSPDRDKAEADK